MVLNMDTFSLCLVLYQEIQMYNVPTCVLHDHFCFFVVVAVVFMHILPLLKCLWSCMFVLVYSG